MHVERKRKREIRNESQVFYVKVEKLLWESPISLHPSVAGMSNTAHALPVLDFSISSDHM